MFDPLNDFFGTDLAGQAAGTAFFFDFWESLTAEGKDALAGAGLDEEILSRMDEEEMREAILGAGLDPGDFGL